MTPSLGGGSAPVFARLFARASAKTFGRLSGKVSPKLFGQASGRTFALFSGKVSGEASAEVSGKCFPPFLGRASGKVSPKLIGRVSGKAFGRLSGNASPKHFPLHQGSTFAQFRLPSRRRAALGPSGLQLLVPASHRPKPATLHCESRLHVARSLLSFFSLCAPGSVNRCSRVDIHSTGGILWP